jgi:hypothetical protein
MDLKETGCEDCSWIESFPSSGSGTGGVKPSDTATIEVSYIGRLSYVVMYAGLWLSVGSLGYDTAAECLSQIYAAVTKKMLTFFIALS